MQVHTQFPNIPVLTKPVITIGTFDGVHLGHRKIIEQLIKEAKSIQGESVLITFEPHPRMVIQPQEKTIQLLTTLQEKIEVLSHLGIDHLVIVPFTTEFQNQPAEEYIELFLIKYFQPHTIIIGYDHQFGKDRSGNYQLFEALQSKFNYRLLEIDKQLLHEITVSSTEIRKSLQIGNLAIANQLLLRPYAITGTVIHGDKRGRTIGYPTANIAIHNSYKLIPNNGVYAIKAIFQGQEFGGMLNIGNRPTVKNDAPVSIEAHLFEFNRSIYDEVITLRLLASLRQEIKFDGIESLIKAIQQDEKDAKKILESIQ
jgi:riboflavin kinase / FMN adenylyltransferase